MKKKLIVISLFVLMFVGVLFGCETGDYKITFNSNGGTFISDIYAYKGKEIILPDNPSKTGYDFVGWYADAAFTNRFDKDYFKDYSPEEHNLIVHAKWTAKNVAVNIVYGKEEVEGPNSLTVKYNERYYDYLSIPQKTGYEFRGWRLNSTNGPLITLTQKILEENAHTIYAEWSTVSGVVLYDNYINAYYDFDIVTEVGDITSATFEIPFLSQNITFKYTDSLLYSNYEGTGYGEIFSLNELGMYSFKGFSGGSGNYLLAGGAEYCFEISGGQAIIYKVLEVGYSFVGTVDIVANKFTYAFYYAHTPDALVYTTFNFTEDYLTYAYDGETFLSDGVTRLSDSYLFGNSFSVITDEIDIKLSCGEDKIKYSVENIKLAADNSFVLDSKKFYFTPEADGNPADITLSGESLLKDSKERFIYKSYTFGINGSALTYFRTADVVLFDAKIKINDEYYSIEAIKQTLKSIISTVDLSQIIGYGEVLNMLTSPAAPDGYVFDGWYSTDSYTKLYQNLISKFDANKYLYLVAKYTATTLNIEFVVNRESTLIIHKPSTQKVAYGTTIKINDLPIMTTSGAVFVGWGAAPDATEALTDNEILIFKNIKLYGIWEEKSEENYYSYYLYNSNGELYGKTVADTEVLESDSKILRIGSGGEFTYKGVMYIYNSAEKQVSRDELIIDANMYSREIQQIYKFDDVNFIFDGKNMIAYENENGYSLRYITSSPYLANKPIYDFTKILTSDVSLYFYREAVTYNVFYHTSTSDLTGTKELVLNNTTVLLPEYEELEQGSNIFLGWYFIDSVGERVYIDRYTLVNECFIQNGAVHLYADWGSQNITLRINYLVDGESYVSAKNIAYGSRIGFLPNAVKQGTFFLGWYYTDVNGKDYLITSDILWERGSIFGAEREVNLEARFVTRLYPILIRYNNGSILDSVWANGAAMYGDEYTPNFSEIITNNGIEKSGYYAVGFNTKADGTGIAYAPYEPITVNGIISLFVQWAPHQITINFHNDKGGDLASKTIYFGEALGALGYLEAEGYGFAGWAMKIKTQDGVLIYDISEYYIPVTEFYRLKQYTETLDLYAKWSQTYYYVRYVEYDENGDYISLGSDFTSYHLRSARDTLVKTNKIPTKKGYEFVGWVDNYNRPFTFGTKIDSDVYIIASWIKIYDIKLDLAYIADENYDNLEVKEFSIVEGLPTPERTGYDFGGWYTEANGGGYKVENGMDSIIFGNGYETLYAYWIPKT